MAPAQAKHQVKRGLLLDVVIGQGAAILQLLASKDQALLVRRDALLVLDLGLDIVNGVAGLDLQGDGLASQGLDKDLHATAQTEHQVESGLLLDVVVSQSAAIFQLLASKDQALLVRRDACTPEPECQRIRAAETRVKNDDRYRKLQDYQMMPKSCALASQQGA